MSKSELVQKQTALQNVGYSQGTIDTVRNSVFPGANDYQLALYFHKCKTLGVHPLDGLVHPSIYNTKNGPTVVFIVSIDVARSKADDTGEYDGQDEPEFEYGEHEDNFEHPTKATVKVYRKNISRPAVGVAYWNEFYPKDDNKRFQWKKMPRIMLSKCAEAQGLRKQFPKELNKLYVEEEMQQANKFVPEEGQQEVSSNGKPQNINPTVTISEKERKYLSVISTKEEKAIHDICKKNKVDIEKLKLMLKNTKGINAFHEIKKGNQYKNICDALQEPDRIAKINAYDPSAPKPKKEDKKEETVQETKESEAQTDNSIEDAEYTPLPKDIFIQEIKVMGEKIGLDTIDKIDTFIDEQFGGSIKKLADVNNEQQDMVMSCFQYQIDNQK